ncbi:MAG: restriction endonuclease subunit S, partial [Planctomycetes bacterium]|nr:restriction endonuclease subunit S [Planctomycetota bacterium]
SEIAKIKIPLPPLEIQNQIVEELDIYQKIISGARQVVENWKPRIDIDPKWERVKFGDNKILQIIDGDRGANYPSKEEFKESGYCLFLNTSNVRKGEFSFNKCDFISQERDEKLRKGKLRREDIVLTTRGTLGNTAHYSTDIKFEHIRINSGMVILRSNLEQMDPKFLLLFLNSFNFKSQVENFMSGSAQPQLPIGSLSQVEISIPPIKLQKDIVKKAETEYSLVDANKKLVDIYDQKIKDVVAKLWEK